jgi:hypothetical protein
MNDEVAFSFGTLGLDVLMPRGAAWYRSNGIGGVLPESVDAGGIARTGGSQHPWRSLVFALPEDRAEDEKAAVGAIKRFGRR